MKRFAIFLPLIFSTFLFTSCIDYVQSVSFKNGKYHVYYKITLSKALFAMAGEDTEDIFDDLDSVSEFVPESVRINKVDTELESGMEFGFAVDPKTKDKDELSFLPTVAGNKCYFPFLLGKDENSFAQSMDSDDGESQAIAAAILSSAKCRVLISKNIIPNIKSAYFEGNSGEDYPISVYDYGDSNCLEIPFIILMKGKAIKPDRIVVIRG